MSLLDYGERLERTVAEGVEDSELRAHMKGCDECRAHYDALVLAARALGDDGSRAEGARLVAALPSVPSATATPARDRPIPALPPERPRPWLPSVAVAFALAAGLLVFITQRKPPPDVTLRGGGDVPVPALFSLRVYAKDAPGLPVHLVADFPASGEAVVGMRADVQLFVQPPPKEGLTLVVETQGAQRTLRAQLEGNGSAELTAVGSAFPAGSLGPGDAKVCAVLVPSGHVGGLTTIDAFVSGGYAASSVVCATLRVSP